MTDKPSARARGKRITRTELLSGIVEVRLGSSTAKVYPVKNKDRVVYQVAWHIGGRRYRTSYIERPLAGRDVKIIDATHVSLPDTPENQAMWPQPAGQKPGCGFPILKLAALFSLASGALLVNIAGFARLPLRL